MLFASRFRVTDYLIQKSVLRGGVGLPDLGSLECAHEIYLEK